MEPPGSSTTVTSRVSPSTHSTRSTTNRDLIGQSRPDIPPRRLPTVECVLRVLAYRRQQPKCQSKGPLAFCCPLNKEHQAQCLLPGGCGEREEPCVQLRATLPYRQAGILTISDYHIQKKIAALSEEFAGIHRHRKIQTLKVQATRDKYLEKIRTTFDITDPNARISIVNDPVRSERAIEEDLAFFDDSFGPTASRKWVMGGRDQDYDQELLTSLLSVEAQENRKKELERKEKARKDKEENERRDRIAMVALEEDSNQDDNDNEEENNGDDWQRE